MHVYAMARQGLEAGRRLSVRARAYFGFPTILHPPQYSSAVCVCYTKCYSSYTMYTNFCYCTMVISYL